MRRARWIVGATVVVALLVSARPVAARPVPDAGGDSPMSQPAANRLGLVRWIDHRPGPGVVAEPDFDRAGVPVEDLRAAAAMIGVELGAHLHADDAGALVDDATRRAAPVLAAARMGTADFSAEALRTAAERLGVTLDGPVDREGQQALQRVANRRLLPLVWASGHSPGGTVDAVDLDAAAERLGTPPRDVGALESAAWVRLAPAFWTLGHDPGGTLDVEDVRGVAHRLGGQGTAPTRVAAADTGSRTMRLLGESVVAPGVIERTWRLHVNAGPVVVRTLHWDLDDDRVQLRAASAGPLNGRAPVPAVAPSGVASAAVNGGFWLGFGEPDGLLVTDGRLLSDPNTGRPWVRGRRGALAVLDDGDVLVGRPRWSGTVAGGGEQLTVHGVNRPFFKSDDLVLYTDDWAARTGTPPGTVEVVLPGTRLEPRTHHAGPAGPVTTGGDRPVPEDGVVVAARGELGARLARAAADGGLTLDLELEGRWGDAVHALTGGPTLISDGHVFERDDWFWEGFSDRHNLNRHPRTAAGFTTSGQGILLVADGRQPGRSVGLTTPETVRLLRSFGVEDGLMLDGGGSSQLVVDGALHNRPCCDQRTRPVSTVLLLHQR